MRVFEEIIEKNIEDRAERIEAINDIIEEGEIPDVEMRERLADYILREELTDKSRSKAYLPEYPILSERQLNRRYEREYAEELADAFGTDGRNHAKPERRRRTAKESRFVDKVSRKRNRQRNAQYRKDTSPGPVVNVISEPFVQCRGIAARWRSFTAR